jgi:hypothetical protein
MVSLFPSTGLATQPGQFASGVQVPKYVAGLNALYENVASIAETGHEYDVIVSADETVRLGTNITIVPSLVERGTGRRPGFVVPFVFLVDPQGNVRASYPWKEVPLRYGLVPADLPKAVLEAMSAGRLAFTYEIPVERHSIGLWTIVVLWTDYAQGVNMPFIAGGEFSFVAVEEPASPLQSPIDFGRTILLTWVGPIIALYGLFSREETRRAASLVAKYRVFIIGLAVMLFALYLSYFVR